MIKQPMPSNSLLSHGWRIALAAVSLLWCSATSASAADDQWVVYPGGEGLAKGKHIVLVSGDEEYRSEEGLPQLGKILSKHYGAKCTVLFAVNPQTGEIDPNYGKNIPGLEALDSADLMIILTRFRDLPDDQMQHIDAYLKAGKPVIGLRTSTHAFNTGNKNWSHYSNGYKGDKKEWTDGFGRLVLGEMWISHHGGHKSESTRGILTPAAKESPILRGIQDGDIWGDTDVYGVRLPLPGDSQPLVLGQVLKGMKPDDAPVEGKKNDPMMPVAWTKTYEVPGGKPGHSFTTTMGSATDLAREGTRRMVVNAALYLLGLEVPSNGANVELVGEFKPTMYGFNGAKKGVKPADHKLSADGKQSSTAAPAKGEKFTLNKGDHISIIGNTLPDREQHDGWLETYAYSRFPQSDLVFRNLGFSADELTTRLRSDGFGSPDDWLTKNQTDVVYAFFGFNESFAGKEGLPKFKQDLENFINQTTSQKYNGKSPPRLVLFSPIAHEDLKSPNLPNGAENNERLKLYTDAMAEVAKAKGVTFVDLFTPSQKLYANAKSPLTINGVHLNSEGNRQIAAVIDEALFGPRGTAADPAQNSKLHAAVQDKNFYWFNRYRTTDGYSSYGGRSYLKFVNDQTNREVMFRELEILDVMTANRDKRIWSIAQGGDLAVNDGNTPPFIPVITNKPGAGPNGTHLFLTGEEALSKMTIGKGLKINLFASEEKFPELI
ncbi:MAG TPA: GDSL-type esterase/lipase family protein, partial [Planctomycetaceae bacterium]|nr:GDSL-type esterase/lipase family protein [Planctomycetaceae bacterium]